MALSSNTYASANPYAALFATGLHDERDPSPGAAGPSSPNSADNGSYTANADSEYVANESSGELEKSDHSRQAHKTEKARGARSGQKTAIKRDVLSAGWRTVGSKKENLRASELSAKIEALCENSMFHRLERNGLSNQHDSSTTSRY